MNESNPLVSVVVVTYNSSRTIMETLNSVKAQTYQNLELIISDDCSTDNTVKIVNDWLEANKKRFVKTLLLTSPTNTGVAPNGNRGNRAASGVWIKGIAGDDTFVPEAMEEYVRFCIENQCDICFAKMKTFGIDEKANQSNTEVLNKMYRDMQLPTRKLQYKTALKRHFLPGPGVFIKKSFFEEIGGFNEKYPLTEEYDFEIRVMQRTKIYFLDKYLVNWRIRPDSLCHSSERFLDKDEMTFTSEVRIPLLLENHMYLYAWDYYVQTLRYKNKHLCNYYIFRILFGLMSPLRVLWKIKRIILGHP